MRQRHNTSRYHNIKSYVSSTLASNYLKFSLHNGTANTVVDVITLKGDKSTTFAGDVTLANGNSANAAKSSLNDCGIVGIFKSLIIIVLT